MELITTDKLQRMNHTARRETEYRQAVHKLITSLHSKRYRPSGMLIHRQNLYAPRSKWRTGRREPVNKVKKKTLCIFVQMVEPFYRYCWIFFIVRGVVHIHHVTGAGFFR
jgi:hypothetical protein